MIASSTTSITCTLIARICTLVLLGLVLSVGTVYGQRGEAILDKYDILNPKYTDGFTETAEEKRAQNLATAKLWSERAKILAGMNAQSGMGGHVAMMFFGDQSGDVKDQRIALAFQISRGSYPSEFELSSDLILDYKQGSLSESVSNIFMSYDYNLTYDLEMYMFVNRFSDTYLAIDQRYEIGGGFIIGNWFKKTLFDNKKGKLVDQEYFNSDKDSITTSTWYPVYRDRLDAKYETDLISEVQGDFGYLQGVIEDVNDAVYKDNSAIKLSLLFGGMAEIEQPSQFSADSCLRNGEIVHFDTTYHSGNFTSNTVWRLTLRPTIQVRPIPGWKISLKPYWKVRVPFNSINAIGEEVFDYRIDFFASSSFSIPVGDTNKNRSVSIGIDYRLHYDNNPHGFALGEDCLFLARDKHHIIRFRFGLSF